MLDKALRLICILEVEASRVLEVFYQSGRTNGHFKSTGAVDHGGEGMIIRIVSHLFINSTKNDLPLIETVRSEARRLRKDVSFV